MLLRFCHIFFSSSHVWMWELDYKESWELKNWCFWTVVLEKTLESPLDCKEIQSVHPKDQSLVFIGRTDVEAETPILWPPDAKSWLIWKDHDAGKDWGQEEKGTTEDEMAGWHHWLDGREFGELVMDREAWRAAVHGVAKCWKWLSNWTELNWTYLDLNGLEVKAALNPFLVSTRFEHTTSEKMLSAIYILNTNNNEKQRCFPSSSKLLSFSINRCKVLA